MTYRPITRWIAALVFLPPGSLALAQDAAWEKNSEAGREAHERGDYAEAERLLRLALDQVEVLGKNDWRTAQVLDELARLLTSQAKFGEAESLAKRSLTIREAAYGRDDLAVGMGQGRSSRPPTSCEAP